MDLEIALGEGGKVETIQIKKTSQVQHREFGFSPRDVTGGFYRNVTWSDLCFKYHLVTRKRMKQRRETLNAGKLDETITVSR